jgi:hypothetical protein
VRAEAACLEPACAYLISAGPAALKTSFSELRATFRAIVGDLAAHTGAGA